ncbi:hypothetical protein DDB_G0293882 [Dictyostelium discoideum AX4]|uniref:Pentatricopeptide repeat-containing protein n=1 Tax=Dictyostelium discoideum TaxID=44689 RepID=Q54B62_DICDI|nr:hypothetical protein DDB_G0293882 [Dictyostelium discoideum AX4]EAL60512.1 hypothetical protein DDB_G0293882 [Dictyostelium discoideum AX4]|eukprot:XP_628926.1 hypothetical protein DDB_G0293882 [Dictyostelium discoideum AX4]
MKRISILRLLRNNKNINGVINYKPTTITLSSSIITTTTQRSLSLKFNNENRFYSSSKALLNGNIVNNEISKSIEKVNDPNSFEYVLSGFYESRKFEKAIKYFEEIRENNDQFKPNKLIVTKIMKCYAKCNKMEKCLELYNENQQDFDIIMGLVLIKGYLDQSNFEEAMKWFEKCQQLNMDNIRHYTVIIGKLSKSGQFSIIDMMLDQIKIKNLKFDTHLYTILFTGLQSFIGNGHLDRTLKLYEQLMNDLKTASTTTTTTDLKMDSKLFKELVECLFYKKLYKSVVGLYEKFKNSNIDFSLILPKILTSYNYDYPNSPNDVIQLWSKIKKPSPGSYACYFHFLNNCNEFNYFPNYKFNIIDIVEKELTLNKNNMNLFQNDIFIVNQIIRYHIIDNDFSSAWSIFQYTLSNSIADVFSFFYILKYLTNHSTNPIVYNNLKEILTSSYYINLTKQYSDYKKVIWIPILKRLNSSEEFKPQLQQTIKLLESHTSESLIFYNKALGRNN